MVFHGSGHHCGSGGGGHGGVLLHHFHNSNDSGSGSVYVGVGVGVLAEDASVVGVGGASGGLVVPRL